MMKRHFGRQPKSFIEDVPMRFSEKYLSSIVSESLLENIFNSSLTTSTENDDDDDDHHNRLHFTDDFLTYLNVEDYKFSSELIALEMFELFEKKNLKRLSQFGGKGLIEHQLPSPPVSSIDDPKASNYVNNNTLPYFSTGEILQPVKQIKPSDHQGGGNSNSFSPKTPVNVICDSNTCDENEMDDVAKSGPEQAVMMPKNQKLVNTREFENDDSSPFDYVELQTIDELKELGKVFTTVSWNLNTKQQQSTPTTTMHQNHDQSAIGAAVNPLSVANYHPQPQTNQYYSNSFTNNTAQQQQTTMNADESTTTIKTSSSNNFFNNYDNHQSFVNYKTNLPTTYSNKCFSNEMMANYQQSNFSSTPNSSSFYPNSSQSMVFNSYDSGGLPFLMSSVNTRPIPSSDLTNHHNYFYTTNASTLTNNDSYTPSKVAVWPAELMMKRSASEKRDLFETQFSTMTTNTATNSLSSRSKSVSDLSKISSLPSSSSTEKIDSLNHEKVAFRKDLSSQRHRSGGNDNILAGSYQSTTATMKQTITKTSKTLVPVDPYDTLGETEKNYVQSLCQMGFKRDRISRAVKHMNIQDHKKIIDYLLTLQEFEDQGYDCYEAEISLHFNDYNKQKAENFLKGLRKMYDFGFDKESSIKALFKTNNDRDKAIDLLLNSQQAK